MAATEPSFREMQNRATVASRIAFLILQDLRRQRRDNPIEAKVHFEEVEASGSLWTAYARAAMNDRDRKEPSAETKFQVRMLVDFALASACIDCGRLAEVAATPDEQRGDELCRTCHRKHFAASREVANG